MKQIALLTLLLLFGLFGAACGTAVASPQPAVTAGSAAGGGMQVDVTLGDNTINSSVTSFKAGVAYTFVIKNTGRHEHNFNIAPPIAVSGSLDASLAKALVTVIQSDLPVGGGTTVEYTFADSAVGAPLEFSCLIKRHYDDGMHLAIAVTN